MNYMLKMKGDTAFLSSCPVFRVLKKSYVSDLVFFIPLDTPVHEGNYSRVDDQHYRSLCQLLKPAASAYSFQSSVLLLNSEEQAVASLSEYPEAPWFAWSVSA